jgi:hypothetical protein
VPSETSAVSKDLSSIASKQAADFIEFVHRATAVHVAEIPRQN